MDIKFIDQTQTRFAGVSEPIRVPITHANTDSKTLVVNHNSIVRLETDCNVFIGITKVQAESQKFQTNFHTVPELKPVKINIDLLHVVV